MELQFSNGPDLDPEIGNPQIPGRRQGRLFNF
jgi:hypothetical protein